MSTAFTITVTDVEGAGSPGDGAVRTALSELGIAVHSPSEGGAREARPPRSGEALRPERDDVYFLSFPEAEEDAAARTPAGDSATARPAGALAERVEAFAESFLAGGPARRCSVSPGTALAPRDRSEAAIVVLRKPGVMDPVEASVLHALADSGLLLAGTRVRCACRHRILSPGWTSGGLSRDTLEAIASGHLANAVVDEWHCFLAGEEERLPDPFREFEGAPATRTEVALRGLDRERLLDVSRQGGLSLDGTEMEAIRDHFESLGREPTDVELESLAQTWSEHCCHKTLTGPIDYDGERIENLLRETIFAATEEIAAPFCWSVFRDNAGVIAIDEEWGLTIKAETHNHPSALEPYGGAGTGIGGVIRDTLGTGLGARPILSTDVFCFGPLDAGSDQLPPGSLHPKRLLEGVVAGVRDYGNRMGIPTACGAIAFHTGYIGNPLVFCGSVGLIPRSAVEKRPAAGDLIVAIGGRTGRDGIHGATFSSRELTEESEIVSSGAVQIGNPIEEKKVQDALLRARDEGLYSALTDCGAGGFSSAVGEMGEELGARVELSSAPLKYAGLSPCEIWISEAQERMVLAVPPSRRARLFEILAEEEVEGAVLGEFTGDGVLALSYRGELVGEVSMAFLHGGRPRTSRRAERPGAIPSGEMVLGEAGVGDLLRSHLAHPSVASKEPVIRQYDHEVQGRTVLRPLGGARSDAPQDGAALDPLRDGAHTVSIGCGLQILLGEIDPYQMGAQAVDEAVRNAICSGGGLDRMALLDNFAWGDVHDPRVLGAIVECARGAADAARALGAPFVSGKDSLHNTFRAGGVARSIPHTLLITAVSVTPGACVAAGSDLEEAGEVLLLVGPQVASLAGSTLQLLYGGIGGTPARFDPTAGPAVHRAVASWLREGELRACHDLSEGGLAVAAAEMAMGADGLGAELDLALAGVAWDEADDATACPALLAALFGEAPHRYLVEVPASRARALTAGARSAGVPVTEVGKVTDGGELVLRHGAREVAREQVAALRTLWQAPLETVWPRREDPA